MRRLLQPSERIVLLLAIALSLASWTSLWFVPGIPSSHQGLVADIVEAPTVHYTRKRAGAAVIDGVCDGYDGVLLIEQGDASGTAGKVFFSDIINQLLYADRFNLLPWVHLNNASQNIYEPLVHGNKVTTFEMMHGMTVEFVSDEHGISNYIPGLGSYYAGPPKKLLEDRDLTRRHYQVTGTGVWNHYFTPVSKFDPSKTDCSDKPLVQLHLYHQMAMSVFCPWSVKTSWPPSGILPHAGPADSLSTWYEPMRQSGSEMVKKYIHFQPHIQQQAEKLIGNATSKCLAMHIERNSNEAATKRTKIGLETFKLYATAYVQAGGTAIFLVTDSPNVPNEISKHWHADVTNKIIPQHEHFPTNSEEVHSVGTSGHDQANRRELTDILAMSKCKFFVHGSSAVSEAVMYLNADLPRLSVNLEHHPQNKYMEASQFESLVRETLKGEW